MSERDVIAKWLYKKFTKNPFAYAWEEIEPEEADYWMAKSVELLSLIAERIVSEVVVATKSQEPHITKTAKPATFTPSGRVGT